jgi:uncharacterized protein YcbK (DUF882 family)
MILSGFRCAEHNYIVGGSLLSRHLSGEAIDIGGSNLLDKYLPEEVEEIAGHAGFTWIKYYSESYFFHFDVR